MRVLVPFIVLFTASALLAQETSAAAGTFSGRIEVPASPLDVTVTLAHDASAGWSGTIDIPAQAARGLELDAIAVEDDKVTFRIKGVPGAPTFRGTLSEDTNVIGGDFRQGAIRCKFKLTRAADDPASLDDFLESIKERVITVMKDWDVPGLGLSVVKKNSGAAARGYGLRDVAKALPVTESTLFRIGSCTKAFTATLAAQLVEEGLLDWDRPVVEYLPEFRMKDLARGAAITPRDMLAHRTGLPRHDLAWYGRDALTAAEVLALIPHLEASRPLRAEFQYNNLMYAAMGEAVARLRGAAFDEVLKERILVSCGMETAGYGLTHLDASKDAATPYEIFDKKAVEIPNRSIGAMGPAGDVVASPKDLGRWLRFQLSEGTADGRKIVSRESLHELHRPQVVIATAPGPGGETEIQRPAYGLGWMSDVYRGRARVHHGGAIDGFAAFIVLFPGDGAGIAVAANLDNTNVVSTIANEIADRLLGLDPIDWNARRLAQRRAGEAATEDAKTLAMRERREDTKPSHEREDYAGTYVHPGYGEVEFRRGEDWVFDARINGIAGRLEHWHYDVFIFHTGSMTAGGRRILMNFATSDAGDVVSFQAALEPALGPVTFTKRPPDRLSDPAFLATLCGKYRLAGGADVSVRVKGERHLTVTVPGQPTYDLEPKGKDLFAFKDLKGYSLRFLFNADGTPAALRFLQPNGVFEARRADR